MKKKQGSKCGGVGARTAALVDVKRRNEIPPTEQFPQRALPGARANGQVREVKGSFVTGAESIPVAAPHQLHTPDGDEFAFNIDDELDHVFEEVVREDVKLVPGDSLREDQDSRRRIGHVRWL